MHAIEKELIKVTAYKARTKFSDRQDYLSSILNAVLKLTDDDFNDLSDDAAGWCNAAVEAKNSKQDELPDFDEVAPDDSEEDEGDDAADEEGDEADGDDDGDTVAGDAGDGDSDADTTAVDDASDDEAEEEPDPSDDEDEPEDDEPEAKPSAKKGAAKPAKVSKPVDKAPVKKFTPPPKPKPPKPFVKKVKVPDEEDVIMDKWGCMEGSKNSQALTLFEKGATTKEVKDAIGGTYYNILKKMVLDGHTMEKEGALIKLMHKDAKKAVAAKPAKAIKKK